METVRISLSRGKFAVIDAVDYERVRGLPWYAFCTRNIWYAATTNPDPKGPKRLYMHRFLMNAPQGIEVDHIDGNGLNNRRSTNLRLATHRHNLVNQRLSAANTSGYKGVYLCKRSGNWAAQTKHKGKHIHFGNHRNKEDAARAYDVGMTALHGEFARLNFPD